MPVLRHPGWLLVCALLLGCTTLPPAEDGEGLRPDDIDRFIIEGKVAWVHPEGRGNANLTWQQDGENFDLLLTGPLGQGAVRLEGNAEAVSLSTPDGTRQAGEADALLGAALGFTIPVAQVRWWVLGVPAPVGEAGPVRVHGRDTHDRPADVEQDGWRIQWSDRRLVEARSLPRRVQLEREGTRLTLVVGAWTLGKVSLAGSSSQ
ncbi:MAG: outer membrane lipoprotein LolB [Gammaproteobacteria bacterium]|nr:outer membrane lipoprotein LolB [Gammaproteobacteria bacterium]